MNIDMDHLRQWIGGEQSDSEVLSPTLVRQFNATFDRTSGTEPGDVPRRARIMILKSLTDSTRVPYLGLLMSDLPRPVQVEENDLVKTGDEKKSLGVFSHVRLEEERAIIPDMDRQAHLVTHATFGALPITQLDG